MINIEAFFKFTYGLYVLSSINKEGKFNGHINNTTMQVTSEPPMFTVTSNKDNLTTEYIKESGIFSISVLQQDIDLNFMGPWGFQTGRHINKFTEDVNYKIGHTGVPILLDNCIAFLECKVVNTIDVGTHLIFIGEVADADTLDNPQAPLTYAYYRDVIKGTSPKNAPTYIDKAKLEQSKKEKKSTAQKYQCIVCGYIYDPTTGDPDSGIAPGTPFEDIPDNWKCPVCGITKKDFNPLD